MLLQILPIKECHSAQEIKKPNKSLHLTHLSRSSSDTIVYGIVLLFKDPRASFPVDQLNEALAVRRNGSSDQKIHSTLHIPT